LILLPVLVFLAVYIAGSLNFAIVILRLLGKGDPRTRFSGNAGATNVYRLAGSYWAGVVLFLDVGRALLAGLIALDLLDKSIVPWVGLCLIAGNRYPCFHGFKGGKGVAGYIGFTAALSPLIAVMSCFVWVMSYAIFRIPFVASLYMVAFLAVGTVIAFGHTPVMIAGVAVTAMFIVLNHRTNIAALAERKKSENRG
jgi:acyl phosphate:glycerol-3-phosphate acyltransferase